MQLTIHGLTRMKYAVAILQLYLRKFLGLEPKDRAGRLSRAGLALTGVFLLGVGGWIVMVVPGTLRLLSIGPITLGLVELLSARKTNTSLRLANLLSLFGQLFALFSFYLVSTRMLSVVYSADGIIGTYMGVVKILQLENPYLYSIKPFLDKFGLTPSYYSAHVDGSFEFHLNYPAFNFLAFLPLYLLGLRDLRDGVLLFYVFSLLIIFGLAPPRMKAISLAPFALYFPDAIAGSTIDSLWAFLLLLSSVLWYRNRKGSLLLVGLAVASKQIAILIVPFLLLRTWHESQESKPKNIGVAISSMLLGFGIPNLPFILLSPSSWWAGIVEPYLPSSVPLVMGGVGLSAILPAMGISAPSILFLATSGLMMTALLHLYHRRYQQVGQFVWILPAIVLFFYHRSLPNYMAYWVIPLMPQLLKLNIRVHPTLPTIPSVMVSHTVRQVLSRLQTGIVPLILAAIVLTAGFVGASGAFISRSQDTGLAIRIDGIGDPDSLGVATHLNLTVTNLGNEPVTPRFFVKWDMLPYIWPSMSPTQVLRGYSTASFTIVALDPLAGIRNHDQFRVQVFDPRTGDIIGQSPLTTVRLQDPVIANPHLKWWVLDKPAGKKAPFRWNLGMSNLDPAYSGMEAFDSNLTSGVRMILNSTLQSSGPASVWLSQKVLTNFTIAELDVWQEPAFAGGSTITRAIFGATVSDGNHLLNLVFSDQVTERVTHVYEQNTTVILPVSSSNWTQLRVNLLNDWSAQSWTLPKELTLQFYLLTYGTGTYYAQVKDIRQTSA